VTSAWPTLWRVADGLPDTRELYELIGEMVSLATRVEWIVGALYAVLVDREGLAPSARRQWDALRRVLREKELTPSLQSELAAVVGHFGPRNITAHATVVRAAVGRPMLIRLSRRNGRPQIDNLTMADLRREVEDEREALAALQRVARALDAAVPKALGRQQPFWRVLVLGAL
jgi:hypothetical protein